MIFGLDIEKLNAHEAKAELDGNKSIYILDVRQGYEFQAGHIKGAKLIPLNELGNRIKELPKDRQILCVCQTGSRSSFAVRQLNNAGLNAINLRGGLVGWQRSGYPISKNGKA